MEPTLIPYRLIGETTGPLTSIARQALTRRPVAVCPAVNGAGTPVPRMRARRASGVGVVPITLRASAATPETCGAAIDVPLPNPQHGPGQDGGWGVSVDRMLSPGAAMSTDVAP